MTSRIQTLLAGALALAMSTSHATDAPPPPSKAVAEAGEELAVRFLEKKPIAAVPTVVFGQGRPPQIRDAMVERLVPRLGPPVGYKIAFATPQMQSLGGVTEPSYGVLLRDMMMQSGVTLPADFAINPQVEGDLLVRIGNEGINKAKTREEALGALDAVYGFVELPDLMYAPTSKEKYGPSSRIAANLGARVGVMGEAIPLERGKKGLDQLGKFTVTLFTAKGEPIAGSSELDPTETHPLDGLLWLRDALRAKGKSLKAGDLISLGTMTMPLPLIELGVDAITARYEGLRPGKPVEVMVRFAQKKQEDQKQAEQKKDK